MDIAWIIACIVILVWTIVKVVLMIAGGLFLLIIIGVIRVPQGEQL